MRAARSPADAAASAVRDEVDRAADCAAHDARLLAVAELRQLEKEEAADARELTAANEEASRHQ